MHTINDIEAPPNARIAMQQARYEAHVGLSEHYSKLIFQGRIATITLTIFAVSIALGLVPGGSSAPKDEGGALLAYAAAVLVSLLHGVEVAYVKRFFQVVACARAIEKEIGVADYFTTYDFPHGTPLRTIYAVAVGALLITAAFGLSSWIVADRPRYLIAAVAALPVVILLMSMRDYDRIYRSYLGANGTD
jgi:hypothetical protein